tara:strand:+ start:1828 stop:3012 length:1185 start_codon:yes stop_codon:yes gene_type:complete
MVKIKYVAKINMKKLLVIHNKYQNIGGEDIAVQNEIEFLENNYQVEVLYYQNKISNYLNDLITFLTTKNKNSLSLLKNKIDSFKPDIVYIHNTWFKASLGVFDLLEKEKIDTVVKLHNFRYFCTRSFLNSKHLRGDSLCQGCGYKKTRFGFLNKYFKESIIKSFFILIYGKRYFSILRKPNLKVLVLTDFHKKFIENLDEFKSKIYVHPNPISVKHNEAGMNNEKYILYAGRVSEEKGVEELINAFLNSELNNIKLKIVGDGPTLNYLKNKYSDNLAIEFQGLKSNEDVIKLIQNSLAVVTATKLYEGQPTLLCEASYLGVPSIYPQTGGINEFFPKNYELAFKQFDYSDLKNKLKAIENKENIKKIGEKNKEFIFTYLSESKVLDRFNMILDE